ncbi:MAG: hypothetical protein B7Y31_09435 [Novosphingobium sp. 16-62-11]|nr:MAG: hypothetical protein B7Y31_09435 [Novosphingobium sp. 16-62-11]
MRVLATDQSTEQVMVEGKTRVRTFSTVTLEVTPKIAEKVAVAQTIGTISLSLRSLADNTAELEQAIASGDIKIPAGVSKLQEEALLKQAMNRPIEASKPSVSTGADVSRFQRSTAPVARAPSSGPSYEGPRSGSNAAPVKTGPVVRVTRGDKTEDVSLGGN